MKLRARMVSLSLLLASAVLAAGCSKKQEVPMNEVGWGAAKPIPGVTSTPAQGVTSAPLGFDRNDYPGDSTMAQMRRQFSFTGYWLTNPPGATSTSWLGKRSTLRDQGWGFLVLANGRLDAEILKAQKAGTAPAELGKHDAQTAVSIAKKEGFPSGAILFLDQEEGGRLLDEQAQYLLGWTEAVAASSYKPGVYASGQPVNEEHGKTITTLQDIRARIKSAHLHDVAVFDYQDACPPSPGCTVQAKPLSAAGEPDLTVWQYAQSPRRPELTQSCAQTYAQDGNCYAPGFPSTFLDLDIASSTDPSRGR